MGRSPRDILARMMLMRRFEETVIHVARAHKLGRQHLAIGHEAIGAAVLMQLQDGDTIYSTHRNHGHMIGRGADPGSALAEVLGREGGLCGGHAGTWHMTDPSLGFRSTSAMVGGSIGLSVGGGFAHKHRGNGAVATAIFGDGALDEGIAYEALNIAALYALPVLFLCENNAKEGEAQTSRLATKELTAVPRALGIICSTVDGGDADASLAAAAAALAHVRAGRGPYFLEAQLVRWPGSHQIVHEFTTGETDIAAAWDPAKASNEHAVWQRTDPILRYARTLIERGAISRDDALALDRDAAETMARARAFAETSPHPQPAAVLAGAGA